MKQGIGLLMDNINDEKLKKYLEVYAQNKNPQNLLEILKHFNIEINKDSIDVIIPYFKVVSYKSIELGSIILDGNWFNFMLKVHNNRITLEITEIKRLAIDKEENNKNEET
jgi:hypothetical protein